MIERHDDPESIPPDADAPAPEPVEVPFTELSPEALRGVIESVVLREGTDYGERELTLEEKAAELLERLRRGEARIVFDPRTQSVDIVDVARRVTSGPRRSGS